jgi:hypothetical protein
MRLDHCVIVVRDLDQAVRDYQTLGFSVAPGGVHADGRTHNALIPFADGSYLELIAFRTNEGSGHVWWQAIQNGGGLVDWAVATEALDERAARLAQAGLGYDVIRDGGRERPDGVSLRWRSTHPAAGFGLPFLIEDVTERRLRVPGTASQDHPNGASGISSVVVAVPANGPAIQLFEQLLEVDASAPEPEPLLATEVVTLACGSATIVLAGATAGPIYELLERLGAGPYALLLSTEHERPGWLDPALSHGAPIRLQPVAPMT